MANMALTRDDISQLRRADSIVFRFDLSDGGYSRIEGSIRPLGSRRFEEPEREFTLPVNPTSVTRYGPDRITAGLWIISPARFVPEWQTVLALLKVGDELHPNFTADAHARPSDRQEPYFTDPICIDTFELVVRRPTRKEGNFQHLTFSLGYQLTKRHGPSARIRNLTTGVHA